MIPGVLIHFPFLDSLVTAQGRFKDLHSIWQLYLCLSQPTSYGVLGIEVMEPQQVLVAVWQRPKIQLDVRPDGKDSRGRLPWLSKAGRACIRPSQQQWLVVTFLQLPVFLPEDDVVADVLTHALPVRVRFV